MPKLGTKVDAKLTKKGVPPVVFAVQPDSYVLIESNEELRQWEEDLRNFLGVNVRNSAMVGAASESCSGGCSDDCDVI
jgi:hypothetical protein